MLDRCSAIIRGFPCSGKGFCFDCTYGAGLLTDTSARQEWPETSVNRLQRKAASAKKKVKIIKALSAKKPAKSKVAKAACPPGGQEEGRRLKEGRGKESPRQGGQKASRKTAAKARGEEASGPGKRQGAKAAGVAPKALAGKETLKAGKKGAPAPVGKAEPVKAGKAGAKTDHQEREGRRSNCSRRRSARA